jgi:phosphoribosylcarboxyaminoimidazole (NCAIR) mutase
MKNGVSIIMGSKSDLAIMEKATGILKEFGIPLKKEVVDADEEIRNLSSIMN